MNRLWMLLFCLGCTTPTEIERQEVNYNLSFLKDVDTVFVDPRGLQVTKHIGAVTNIRDGRLVLMSSNIYFQVTAGFGQIDTLSTVNEKSYVSNGYVGAVFGAFPNMIGLTATIIARVVDDIRTVEEYKNLDLRKVLAVDTMKIVIVRR